MGACRRPARVLLSRSSTVVWPPPTSPAASPWTSLVVFYQWCQRMWAADGRRSPLFHRLLSQHSAPPTPRRSSRLPFQTLHLSHGLRLSLRGSTLLCPLRVHLTTRQDSRDGTDCCVAPPSRSDAPLQHTRSPRSTGSPRRGALALPTTGLAPVSRRCLSRRTNAWLAGGPDYARFITAITLLGSADSQ
jgi:hypothetical protein